VPRPSRPRWQSRDRRRSARTRSAETKWRTARERLSCPAGNDGIEDTGRGRKRARPLRVLERDGAQRRRPSVRHMPIRGREGRGPPQTQRNAYGHTNTFRQFRRLLPAPRQRPTPIAKITASCPIRNEKELTSSLAIARLWRCARRPGASRIPQASIPAKFSIARATLQLADAVKCRPSRRCRSRHETLIVTASPHRRCQSHGRQIGCILKDRLYAAMASTLLDGCRLCRKAAAFWACAAAEKINRFSLDRILSHEAR
jgi:hypothetical protein